MYPRISDLFEDLFGFAFPIPIYSFGAMVALAILIAAWLSRRELDRMYGDGRIGGVRLSVNDRDKSKRRRAGGQVASPSALMGTVVVLVVVLGIAGSKLFHILENLDDFAADPVGMIFSTGGLTFYGGLLCAGLGVAWYVRKNGVSVGAFADAIAPGLMLAYGIGRIGCYLAGDGDWGICSNLEAKPGWLPAWLWSETFPRSILDPGNTMTNDALVFEQCPPGADGVFPTMLYEFGMAAVLFGVLWAFRKHRFRNGWLFSLYLVFNGVERFLIEQIRVNNVFELLGIRVTQAEIISTLILLAGVVGLVLTTRSRVQDAPRAPSEVASTTT